ncbi:SPOR domain-containing protein [Thalassotalea psychrophila]|uniref:SPOR domain-containing protein n=1 Tax=Thalassotalea psychrophila TaxID=3065647 RepID=A0ABY9U223_9GAMM|nr:SPOR domain-containing protein [Colwelliaceae bacterium SQ149]
MSTPFQNRIVGTIIIAAAAIIFLPDVFDGEKQAYQAQFEAVPEGAKPVKKIDIKAFPDESFSALNKTQPLAKDTALDDSLKQANDNEQKTSSSADELQIKAPIKQASTTVAAKPLDKPKSKTETAATGKPKVINVTPPTVKKTQAYVIQLGSFKHKKNVAQLVKKLKSAGYTVFTKPIKTSAGNLTKVFIGPEINKASLQAKLPKLKQLSGVQGRIAVYQPIDK